MGSNGSFVYSAHLHVKQFDGGLAQMASLIDVGLREIDVGVKATNVGIVCLKSYHMGIIIE